MVCIDAARFGELRGEEGAGLGKGVAPVGVPAEDDTYQCVKGSCTNYICVDVSCLRVCEGFMPQRVEVACVIVYLDILAQVTFRCVTYPFIVFRRRRRSTRSSSASSSNPCSSARKMGLDGKRRDGTGEEDGQGGAEGEGNIRHMNTFLRRHTEHNEDNDDTHSEHAYPHPCMHAVCVRFIHAPFILQV